MVYSIIPKIGGDLISLRSGKWAIAQNSGDCHQPDCQGKMRQVATPLRSAIEQWVFTQV